MMRILMTTLVCAAFALAPAFGVLAEEAAAVNTNEAAAAADLTPEQALKQRLAEYWQHRLARSHSVYSYYRPADKGGPLNYQDVTEGGQIYAESYEVIEQKIDGDRAVLKLKVKYAVTLPYDLPDDLMLRDEEEKWERFEGTWFKVGIPRPHGVFRGPEWAKPANAKTADTVASKKASGND